jgi:hypothetical protein
MEYLNLASKSGFPKRSFGISKGAPMNKRQRFFWIKQKKQQDQSCRFHLAAGLGFELRTYRVE